MLTLVPKMSNKIRLNNVAKAETETILCRLVLYKLNFAVKMQRHTFCLCDRRKLGCRLLNHKVGPSCMHKTSVSLLQGNLMQSLPPSFSQQQQNIIRKGQRENKDGKQVISDDRFFS